MVFAGGVSLSDVGGGARAADLEGVVVCVFLVYSFFFFASCFCCVIMRVPDGAEGGGAHGHQFDEEEEEDGHEGDAFGPVVGGYGAGEAGVCEGVAGRGEELGSC